MSSCGNPNCISCYLKGVASNSVDLNLPVVYSDYSEETSEVGQTYIQNYVPHVSGGSLNFQGGTNTSGLDLQTILVIGIIVIVALVVFKFL